MAWHRPVSLVIADDHPVVLHGLVSLISTTKDFTIVATCANGVECINAMRTRRPDLALIDINMPILNGIEVLRTAAAEKLSSRIIFLAASPDDSEIVIAATEGAYGIMLKEAAPDALIGCLRGVVSGRRWLPPELVDAALARARAHPAQAQQLLKSHLTRREREVTLLVAEGFSNKEVGRRLNITEGTVKIHLSNIYQKVSVTNRTALANFAILYREQLSD